MRFASAQGALDRRVAGRKRTREEMLANGRRLAGLWDAMPEDEPAKRRALEEWRDELREARLARLALPRDGVQGDSATVSGLREVAPGSAHGAGSAQTPLAGAVLDVWRRRQRSRGLQVLAAEPYAKG